MLAVGEPARKLSAMHSPPALDDEALAKLLLLGGPKFAGNMVDIFLGYAPTKLAEALAAEAKGDCVGVEDAMHPLKTCAGHVGAVAVSALAVELGDLAHAQDRVAIPLKLAALERAFAEVKPLFEAKRQALAAG